jgi:Icc-related predicted phosphoesterase
LSPTVTPVRYLLASDLHYALPQLDWIAQQAPDFDAVVLAGDHLDVGGYVELGAQIVMMSAYLGHLADITTVIANSGNHDLSSRRDHGEKAAVWLDDIDPRVITDGASTTVGADLVSVCAWWEGPVTKAEVGRQLDHDAAQRPTDGAWIWVYHSPPHESPTSWTGKRHYGDDVLNAFIDEHHPDLVLAGHVHESPFRPDGSWHDRIGDTVILNAGRQLGQIPAHIIIDTAAGSVDWWSIEAAGSILL